MAFQEESYEAVISVLDCAHGIRRILGEHTKSVAGLTFEQALLLCRIDRAGGEANMSHLARSLSRTTHSVTTLVDNTESQGLVTRVRDLEGDRRQGVVRITAEGREKLQAVRTNVVRRIVDRFNAQPDPAQLLASIEETLSAVELLVSELKLP